MPPPPQQGKSATTTKEAKEATGKEAATSTLTLKEKIARRKTNRVVSQRPATLYNLDLSRTGMGYLSPTLSRRGAGPTTTAPSSDNSTAKDAQSQGDEKVKLVLHCPPDLRDVIAEETTALRVDPETTLDRATAQYWATHAARLSAHVHYAEFAAMLRRCAFAPAVALLDVDTRAFQHLLPLFEGQGCAWAFAKAVVDAAVAGAPTMRELLKPDGVVYRVTGMLLQMKMRTFLRRALQPVFRHLFEQPEENYLAGTPDECLAPQNTSQGTSTAVPTSSSVPTTSGSSIGSVPVVTGGASTGTGAASGSVSGPSTTSTPGNGSNGDGQIGNGSLTSGSASQSGTTTGAATGAGTTGITTTGTGGNTGTAPQILTERRQLHILNVTLLFLAAITESVMSLPKEVRALAWYLQCSCQQFADFHEDAISGFVFARLFPPAVVAPERFGVFEACDGGEPLDAARLSQNTVFVLKCVAKILLYSSTAQASLARDQYLTSMQQEIECVKRQTFYMLHRIFVPTYAPAPAAQMDALPAPAQAGTEYTSLQDLLQAREEAFVPALRDACARLRAHTRHLAAAGDDICAFYDLCVERGLISRDTLVSKLPEDLMLSCGKDSSTSGSNSTCGSNKSSASNNGNSNDDKEWDASALAVEALRLGRTLLHPKFKYHVKVFQTDHYLDTDPLFGSQPVREWKLLSFCRHLNQDPQLEFVEPETYAQDIALLKQLSRIGGTNANNGTNGTSTSNSNNWSFANEESYLFSQLLYRGIPHSNRPFPAGQPRYATTPYPPRLPSKFLVSVALPAADMAKLCECDATTTPQTLIDQIVKKFRVDGGLLPADQIALKLLGREEYLLYDDPRAIRDCERVRELLRKSFRPSFVVCERRALCLEEPVHAVFDRVDALAVLGDDEPFMLSCDVRVALDVLLDAAVLPAAHTPADGTSLYVEAALYYGGQRISPLVRSRPVGARAQPLWGQRLSLGTLVSAIPREARICFTLYSVPTTPASHSPPGAFLEDGNTSSRTGRTACQEPSGASSSAHPSPLPSPSPPAVRRHAGDTPSVSGAATTVVTGGGGGNNEQATGSVLLFSTAGNHPLPFPIDSSGLFSVEVQHGHQKQNEGLLTLEPMGPMGLTGQTGQTEQMEAMEQQQQEEQEQEQEETESECYGDDKNRVAVGWTSCRVFDHCARIVSGEVVLPMLEGASANPVGICVDSMGLGAAPGTMQLRVVFPRGPTVLYPDDEDLPEAPEAERAVPKMDTGDFARATVIVTKDPLYVMSEDEKRFIWRQRWNLRTVPEALPKVVLATPWTDPGAVRELHRVVGAWAQMEPLRAIELLDSRYPDAKVRAYAVRCLERLPLNDLEDWMMQLVQALKCETYHNSPLALHLLAQALDHRVRIGHTLFWMLQAEMHIPAVRERFRLLTQFYLRGSGAHRTIIMRELDLVDTLMLANRAKSFAAAAAAPCFDAAAPLPLPHDPSLAVTRLLVDKCRVLDSARAPLWLAFENADPLARDPVLVLFKATDDLRQDMLALQVLKIMNERWERENLDMRISQYRCVALGAAIGMIEVVPDCTTIADIQKTSGGGGVTAAFKERTISEWLRKKNADSPMAYQNAVENFIYSCAGYCVATYLLGVGDRHNDNILLTRSGNLFHIDFGHILGNAEKWKGFKRDRAPFVLTPEFAYVMGGKDSPAFAVFSDVACNCYLIVRRDHHIFINLFSMVCFLFHPFSCFFLKLYFFSSFIDAFNGHS